MSDHRVDHDGALVGFRNDAEPSLVAHLCAYPFAVLGFWDACRHRSARRSDGQREDRTGIGLSSVALRRRYGATDRLRLPMKSAAENEAHGCGQALAVPHVAEVPVRDGCFTYRIENLTQEFALRIFRRQPAAEADVGTT